MLFNSFQYLAVFLPLAWLIYFVVCWRMPRWRLEVLLVLSLAFYAYWDWRFIFLIVPSISVNWLIARYFAQVAWAIPFTIAANLAVLGIFKYLNFFAGLLPHWLHVPALDIVLPLGISFFTFHHVMYLTDLRRKQAPEFSFVQYGLYIAFFPQVLAGPLVRWREVMHQFQDNPFVAEHWPGAARGLMLIVLGLCEKIILGDNLARIAGRIFSAAETADVTQGNAWLATLSFSFQIFFDFSGYTDMALGSALLFGIVLPQNFNAPYRAASLQDFWRRWHMTLSRFLRDYLYIPLGGNRHGLPVQLFALFTTMALGGLWHGAGLTFIAWGVLHGLGLGAEVLWRRGGLRLPALFSWPLTFLFVMLCWVPFRAATFTGTSRMYGAMFGLTHWTDSHLDTPYSIGLIGIAAAVALLMPNSSEFLSKITPRTVYAIALGLVSAIAVLALNSSENFEFIYFHF